jgi:outer membrane receptor for ferrienterochelin and colicins
LSANDIPEDPNLVVISQYKNHGLETEVQRSTTVIQGEEIAKQNINNLRDLLINIPGIEIKDDPVLQTSSITMNGISGENIRVYVDGVPVIGLVSGKLDVSSISLAHVEKVEIIETPLSVEYAGNAVGGVIAITTTSAKGFMGLNSSVTLATESSGLFSKYATLQYGGENHRVGAHLGHLERSEVKQEGSRIPLWSPSETLSFGLMYGLSFKTWDLRLQYDGVLDEKITTGDWFPDPSTIAFDEDAGEFLASDSNAKDIRFSTARNTLNLHASFDIGKASKFENQISLADYQRKGQDEYSSLLSGEDSLGAKVINYYNAITMSSLFKSDLGEKVPILIGVDGEYFTTEGPRVAETFQDISTAGAFMNTAIKHIDLVSLELGARTQYNSKYKIETLGSLPIIPSFVFNIKFSPKTSSSFGYSRGFRSPSLQELYFNFHDGGSHNIDGNPDLDVETSNNYFINLQQKANFKDVSIKQRLMVYYHDLENKILLAENANRKGTHLYQNVGKYKSLGLNLNQKINLIKTIKCNTSYGIHGTSVLEDDVAVPYVFLFKPNAMLEISYLYLATDTELLTRYNYHGAQQTFRYEEDELKQGLAKAWQQLDFILSQKWKMHRHKIRLSLGIKNILNVKKIETIGDVAGGAHSSAGPIAVARGRIFYGNIRYNF